MQQAINRIQSIETTRHCIDAMREHGVKSVNIDLIYGLPYQTPAHMEATVRAVLDMAPDRIALFGAGGEWTYKDSPHLSGIPVEVRR